MPIALAILLSFVLAPLVGILQRIHVPRGLAVMYRVMSDDAERHEGGKRDILTAIAGRPISAQ